MPSQLRSEIAQIVLNERIAAAERSRIASAAAPQRSRRIDTVRLLARTLRVEREIDFCGPLVPRNFQ